MVGELFLYEFSLSDKQTQQLGRATMARLTEAEQELLPVLSLTTASEYACSSIG
jgi:hypothetical protein